MPVVRQSVDTTVWVANLLEIDRRLEQPEVIVLPMGRLDIADYLGTTLETISRACQRFVTKASSASGDTRIGKSCCMIGLS
jgi:CRP-like cAMP-binding protein